MIGFDMANWQDTAQNCVIAGIFAFMVAKLVSFVISFRRNSLRIEREASKEWLAVEGLADDGGDGIDGSSSESELEDDGEEDVKVLDNDAAAGGGEAQTLIEKNTLPTSEVSVKGPERATDADVGLRPLDDLSSSEAASSSHIRDEGEGDESELRHPIQRDESVGEVQNGREEEVDANASSKARGELSDSDDWEGVESTELEERFGAAAAFVATQAIGRGLKVSNDIQLFLYGLYKLATEGPCCIAQPPAYKMSARAKWNAWQKLGNIEPEEAMHRYIAVVSEIDPVWAQALDENQRRSQESVHGETTKSGGMGPVFSSLVTSDDVGGEAGNVERIHVCAREGDEAGLREQIETGTAIDLTDSDGHTALHWAADRGHLQVIELLLSKGAQINAKDSDRQTALHYAVTCEREEIAKVLVNAGADPSLKDSEGVCPLSSRPKHWVWMASPE